MFETIKIRILGKQPVPKVSNRMLDRLIQRDYQDSHAEVKQKLNKIISATHSGKNRISAAILKLSNQDLSQIDHYIEIANTDFRDVISKAEYPSASQYGFNDTNRFKMKHIYLADWFGYSKWLSK